MSYDNTNTLTKPTFIPFMRMTVLGMTGCGKTAFVNAFVNSACPNRYVSTERQVLYYKKMDVRDEGEFDEIQRPIFIEVEDTPGSEKGPAGAPTAAPDADSAESGPPTIKRGSRVEVLRERHKVLNMFNSEEWRGKLEYKKAMDGMLGKEFTVKIMARDGSIGLPSPDGSEGGVWNFPRGAVQLKVTPEVPLDKFLSMNRNDKYNDLPKDPKERREKAKNFERPVAAFERPIGPPDQDKALTRNRMGFFICFDLSEESSTSLKEAMNIHMQLKKYLKSRGKVSGGMLPVVMLIGTKNDKTANYKAIEINSSSAKLLCDQEDIKMIETSAKTNHQVELAFQKMVDAISSKEGLWQLEGADDPGGEAGEGEAGYCAQS